MNDSEKRESVNSEKNKINSRTLYLVATPIGNLSDISQRAVNVLNGVDFIAAEDTRNSGKLLLLLGILKKPMVSYFEHNKREKGAVICERLMNGESCALITDAGTPGISDPGEDIVAMCIEKGITVTSVPGCCAGINALILSGLPTGRFVFEGFLPTGKSERAKRLVLLSEEKRTVILYEAPHRLSATLFELYGYFGDRQLALCREMTKLNEEIMRTDINTAAEYYKENKPRGEYVLVIKGREDESESIEVTPEELIRQVEKLIEGGTAKNEAIKLVASKNGVSRSIVYDTINKIK